MERGKYNCMQSINTLLYESTLSEIYDFRSLFLTSIRTYVWIIMPF